MLFQITLFSHIIHFCSSEEESEEESPEEVLVDKFGNTIIIKDGNDISKHENTKALHKEEEGSDLESKKTQPSDTLADNSDTLADSSETVDNGRQCFLKWILMDQVELHVVN